MIHLLYTSMGSFLRGLFNKFIGKKHLQEEKDDHILPKPIVEIISLDHARKELQKPITAVDIGTKTKSIFIQSAIIDEEQAKFRQECIDFLVTSTKHLLKKLPYKV